MQEEYLDTVTLNGKEYFLVDSIQDTQNTIYHFFSNGDNPSDLRVMKDGIVDGEVCFVSLNTESEFNYALGLFFEKHKDDHFE